MLQRLKPSTCFRRRRGRQRLVDWQAPGPVAEAAPPRHCSIPPWAAPFPPCCRPGRGPSRSTSNPLSVRSETISAEGKLIKLGRQTSYAEGFVRDGAGHLAVHATATFSMIGEQAQSK
jgi:hypothetical protein